MQRWTSNDNAGLGLAVAASTAFGTSGAFGAALLGAGWTPAAAVTVRIAVAALVLTGPAVAQLRGRWSMLSASWRTLGSYGLLAVAGAQVCYFNAVTHLSVGVALLLEYLGTLLVVAWLWLRQGQRPRPLTIAGAVVAVVGLVLVLDLTGSQRLDPVGVLWGLGAAVGLASFFLLSADVDDALPPLVMAWGGLSVGALGLGALGLAGALPMRAARSDVVLGHHRVSWLVPVLGLSLIAAVVAYLAGIAAVRRLGARVASFVGLTEVLFAILFAWLLLGQVPALVQLVGGALILGGVALVRIDELRTPELADASTVHGSPDWT